MAKRKGKYWNKPSNDVAQLALGGLIEKIPEMVQNYARNMPKFASDTDAQNRFVTGVALWVDTIRAHAGEISQVMGNIKAEYTAKKNQLKRAVTPTVTVRGQVIPIAVRR